MQTKTMKTISMIAIILLLAFAVEAHTLFMPAWLTHTTGHAMTGMQTAQSCVAAPSGLIEWFPFESFTNGNTNSLVSGSSLQALVSPVSTVLSVWLNPTSTPAKVGNGISIDVARKYLAMGLPTQLKTPTLTYAMWVKTTSPSGTLMFAEPSGSGGAGLGAGLALSGGKVGFTKGSNGPFINVQSTAIVNDGNWHFVAASFDGKNMNVSVDGVLSGTLADSKPIGWTDQTNQLGGCVSSTSGSCPSPAQLYLGGFKTNQNVIFRPSVGEAIISPTHPDTNFFTGMLDEVQIYNRVLTAEEIQAIFNAGSAGVCTPGQTPTAPATTPTCASNAGATCNRNQCGGTGIVKCDGITCTAIAPTVPTQVCGCGGTIQCDGTTCSAKACASVQTCTNGKCVTPAPGITSLPLQLAVVGRSYNYQIKTNVDGLVPLTYNIKSNPSFFTACGNIVGGPSTTVSQCILGVISNTGLFGYVPARPEFVMPTVTVCDSLNRCDEQTISLHALNAADIKTVAATLP